MVRGLALLRLRVARGDERLTCVRNRSLGPKRNRKEGGGSTRLHLLGRLDGGCPLQGRQRSAGVGQVSSNFTLS